MFTVTPRVRLVLQRSVRRYKMYKRVLFGIATVLCIALAVHLVYFQRPPTEDILTANRRRHTSTLKQRHPKQLPESLLKKPHNDNPLGPLQQTPQQLQKDTPLLEQENQLQFKQKEQYKDSPSLGEKESVDEQNQIIKGVVADQDTGDAIVGELATEKTAVDVIKRAKEWEQWIEMNGFVSIGDIYDECDGAGRLQVGKVILLEDKENGGIKTRTFVNATFPDGVVGGDLFIQSSYNGRELYHNQWDVCTVEEDMDDQVIFCPLEPGEHHFAKDIPIPNYLPKGTYTSKTWVVNENEDLLGCSFTSFTI